MSRETHPVFFENGSQVNSVDTSGLYAIADKSKVSLVNTWDVKGNRMLRFSVHLCDEKTKLEPG